MSAFVIAQDWGTALAFYLAARRPEFIRGLAFMEFIRPMPTWKDFHPEAIETFQKFRTREVGEEMILEDNTFVEGVLPSATVRKLTDEEMSVYRAPFPSPESRRPTWRFPNELPIAGEPADVYSILEKAHRALAQSSYPKLLFAGNPGALVSPAFAESFAKGLKNCRVVQLSSGIHYLQEDHPDVIGASVKEWLIELGVSSSPNTFMAEDFKENKSPHEIAQAMHDEVQIARDSALKAHLRFEHSDHRVATEFMHLANHLNQVLADLNRMVEETQG
jgi:haloalkane dehalogenase